MDEIKTILRQGLETLGLTRQVPPEAPERLERYGQLLLEKNRVMNLTAIREPEGVARLHMLDCAALLTRYDFAGKSLIDVGTGAGFPGVVLKTLTPSLDVTLLDSLNKRLDWLEETCALLGLENIRILRARAEEQSLLPPFRDGFDFAAARAVAELSLLCELCLPFVRVGGLLLAMKGPDCREELERAGGAIRRLGGVAESVWTYTIPGTDITHCVASIRKTAPTPKGYPRKWAKIKKEPL